MSTPFIHPSIQQGPELTSETPNWSSWSNLKWINHNLYGFSFYVRQIKKGVFICDDLFCLLSTSLAALQKEQGCGLGRFAFVDESYRTCILHVMYPDLHDLPLKKWKYAYILTLVKHDQNKEERVLIHVSVNKIIDVIFILITCT